MIVSWLIPILSLPLLALSDPLFLLSSTVNLPLSASDHSPNPAATTIQSLLYRILSTCPTTHYAVIIEPRILGHSPATAATAHLPTTPNAQSSYLATSYTGRINLNHLLNTILMDCLHHGVLRVHEIDTQLMYRGLMPSLSRNVVRESIIYARLPEVSVDMTRDEYAAEMARRRAYIQRLLDVYFGDEDYLLVYWREEEVVVVGKNEDALEKGDGKQVPLVED